LQAGHQHCYSFCVTSEIVPATEGAGPLLQRDYWAVFEGTSLRPSGLIAHVKAHFCEFPPRSLVEFAIDGGVEPGNELDIRIKPMQQCRVKVVHCDRQSLTLATLEGHPEAGRITFGAYRNAEGELVFHIRSRARSASTATFLGFLAVGEAMQTNTWVDFITNVATAVGARIRDVIHAETTRSADREDDQLPLDQPTFAAVGD
jgi:uncharacterized protein (UPF0548 family)